MANPFLSEYLILLLTPSVSIYLGIWTLITQCTIHQLNMLTCCRQTIIVRQCHFTTYKLITCDLGAIYVMKVHSTYINSYISGS